MTRIPRLVFSLVLAGVLVAGCGGGGDAESETTDSGGSATTRADGNDGGAATTDAEGETTTTTDAAEETTTTLERIICQVPEPASLVLGEPTEGEVLGWDECFTVDVPSGVSELTVELTGLQDELNLVVAFDDPEVLQTYVGQMWESREDGLDDESITIESPEAGTYYINVSVATYRNESPFTLTATTS